MTIWLIMKRGKFKISILLTSTILAIFGIIIGLVSSFLCYEFVLVELNFSLAYQTLILVNLSFFLSLSFAFSQQIRCITILTFPQLGSTAGKRVLQASVMILLLGGPVNNINKNSEEVVRLVSCLKDITVNITLSGKDLILAPIQHIISDLKSVKMEEKLNFSQLSGVMDPVVEEINDINEINEIKSENDLLDLELGHDKRSNFLETTLSGGSSEADRVEKLYKKKMAYRCEVFSQDKICDMDKVIGKDFGENYVTAHKGIDDFTKKFSFKINYEGITNFVNIDSLHVNKEQALEAFERSRDYVEFYLNVTKRTLAFSFLFLIFSALNYHGKYFSLLSFDNVYITNYFLKIDERRVSRGKVPLLPLKSFEASSFTKVFRLRLRGDEIRRFYFQLIVFFLQALLAAVLFLFDLIFTRLLLLVQRHTNVTFTQTGTHGLNFSIEGVGFLAQLLRSILGNLNVEKNIDVLHLTEPCLPNPSHLPRNYIHRTLILFSLLFFLAYLEAFSIRTRHCITNFFYPRRSKERILWLYNETKRKRQGKLEQLKEQVLLNADELKRNVDYSLLLSLRQLFPRLCSCLKIFSGSKPKCILCKRRSEFFRCSKCSYFYCEECYKDIDKRCLYCIASSELKKKMYVEEESENERAV